MTGPELQDRATAHADTLPAAERDFPFGPEWEVYKVGGKVFMLLTAVTGTPMVILKATPEDSERLRQTYDAITPGYHMNKRHWLTLTASDDLNRGSLIEDLITDSYLLVVEKLPKVRRPVTPTSTRRQVQHRTAKADRHT
jgi:predicted DNA-binding protein (MmcQ/YjbR family)